MKGESRAPSAIDRRRHFAQPPILPLPQPLATVGRCPACPTMTPYQHHYTAQQLSSPNSPVTAAGMAAASTTAAAALRMRPMLSACFWVCEKVLLGNPSVFVRPKQTPCRAPRGERKEPLDTGGGVCVRVVLHHHRLRPPPPAPTTAYHPGPPTPSPPRLLTRGDFMVLENQRAPAAVSGKLGGE